MWLLFTQQDKDKKNYFNAVRKLRNSWCKIGRNCYKLFKGMYFENRLTYLTHLYTHLRLSAQV